MRNEKKVEEILQGIRQRKEESMEVFLLQYSPLIRYIIAPILSDAREQEECLQDVAMRVWDRIEQYDESKGRFTSWLTALTRNAAFNRAKAKRSQDCSQEIPTEMATREEGPEEQVLRQERQKALKRALNQLSPKEQQLFYRKYYYMQSIAQIGAEMGMTERAVEGRLYRIKQKLRKELGGEWYE